MVFSVNNHGGTNDGKNDTFILCNEVTSTKVVEREKNTEDKNDDRDSKGSIITERHFKKIKLLVTNF